MITNARALRPEHIPQDLHHRDGQIDHLSSVLDPSGLDFAEDVCIFGPSGAGKTTISKYTLGRLSDSAVRDAVYQASHPCMMGECPHDRIPDECEAVGWENLLSKCPSARGPHSWRRGAITHHLLDGTPVEVVSERMDVSLEILYKHYDARRPDQKMDQRRKFLSDK